MAQRPTEQDHEHLEELAALDGLDRPSEEFIEEQWRHQDEGTWTGMSPKQWAWFDKLVERWL